MDDEDFWYWLSLSEPSYYFLGKAMGGKAAKGADRAMESMTSAAPVILILVVVATVIVGFVKLFGG